MNDIVVLQTSDLPTPAEEHLRNHFQLVRLDNSASNRNDVLARHGEAVRAIAGSGKGKVDASLIESLPNLEIISVTSAGLDAIDVEAASRRQVPIFNTSKVLADDVADIALWLVLGTMRSLVQADRFVREGRWPSSHQYPLGKTIAGSKVGILGLGHIGKMLARRLEVLGATIGYAGRSRKPDIDYPYFPDALALAGWSDLLVVSCPATAQTHNLVDRDVLRALGPDGILVNISRGSIVDETALIEALEAGEIFAAGLDVFANEPVVPEALIKSDRTIILPHIGSATVGTRTRMWQAMVDALFHHFRLRPADWGQLHPLTNQNPGS